MSVVASVVGKIQLTDNVAGTTTLSKVLDNVYIGSISEFGQNVLVGTSPLTISIPNGLAQFIYIKNTSTTASVLITWTPNAGASESICYLDPSALLILAETAATQGITALSLQATAASTPVEFILVG